MERRLCDNVRCAILDCRSRFACVDIANQVTLLSAVLLKVALTIRPWRSQGPKLVRGRGGGTGWSYGHGGQLPIADIEARKRALRHVRMASQYQRQKCGTWRRLVAFLARLPGRPTPESCTPDDVVGFLIYADVAGKTVVHSTTCPRVHRDPGVMSLKGVRGGPCGCPLRLAYGSVDSMIGRLRSAFHDGGRSVDNPAAMRAVKMYLRDVRYEQLRAGIVPKQALPLFSHKLRLVSVAILRVLRRMGPPRCGRDGVDRMRGPRFKLLRTRAMLLLAQVSLKRGKELGQTKTSAILRLPDGGGLLLNYVWGKTLREGSKHVFGVLRKSDVVLCPVAALEEYVAGAKAMDITLSGHGRFLFPPWRGLPGEGVDNIPLSSGQLTTDLQFWLRRCGVFHGETAHGLRTGSSIELSLSGKGLAEVMRQACWTSKGMARYYMKEWQVLCASVAGEALPKLATALEYEKLNSMLGFCKAF